MLAREPQLLAKLPAALTANGLSSRAEIGKIPTVLQGQIATRGSICNMQCGCLALTTGSKVISSPAYWSAARTSPSRAHLFPDPGREACVKDTLAFGSIIRFLKTKCKYYQVLFLQHQEPVPVETSTCQPLTCVGKLHRQRHCSAPVR